MRDPAARTPPTGARAVNPHIRALRAAAVAMVVLYHFWPIPALEIIARERGWRIDLTSKGGCSWTASAALEPKLERTYHCQRWQRDVGDWLMRAAPYEAILVTQRSGRLPAVAAEKPARAQLLDGLTTVWKTQIERGARIIAVADNPRMDPSVTACVRRHLSRANEMCSVARERAFTLFDGLGAATRLVPNARFIDLGERYCDERTCYPLIGHVIVYRDKHHITATYARTLAPFLLEQLELALR